MRQPLTDALEFAQPTLEEKGLRLTVSLGAKSCLVLGNAAELEQLFLNLLLNAHEATSTGGAVLVELACTDTQVTIAVKDNGPGVPNDLVERVFEPFFSTKARGSGLGLAISAGIAQAHGARIRAGNGVAGGAVFTIDFPLVSVVPAVTA